MPAPFVPLREGIRQAVTEALPPCDWCWADDVVDEVVKHLLARWQSGELRRAADEERERVEASLNAALEAS